MSNTFPSVSPDGRWIVFVQCRNGQLMRPDSQLYIVPAGGGVARRMRCNTPLMNSWHSFSPNGHWLVFSSKSRSPYTQMFLTHLDEHGNDSPAILIDNATAANRAVNIPEFVNIPPDSLMNISVPAAESYRLFDLALASTAAGQIESAIAEWNKVLELDPANAKAHNNLGLVLLQQGRLDEGIAHFRKAVEIDPEYGAAQNNLGVWLLRRGSLDDAITHLQKALEVSPGYARTYEAVIADFKALTGPLQAKLRFEDVEHPVAQDEVRELETQYRRRLDTVIGCIAASGDGLPLTSEIQRDGLPSRPNAGVAGHLKGPGASNLPANLDSPGRECSEIYKLIADLEISRLRKLAAQKKSTDEGVAAQRQILRIFLHTFEAGSQLLERRTYARAALCFEIAAQAAPNDPYILYSLARVLALNNQKERALQTLEMAADKGFNNSDQLEGDRAFEGLRENSGYKTTLAKMRGAKPQTQVAP